MSLHEEFAVVTENRTINGLPALGMVVLPVGLWSIQEIQRRLDEQFASLEAESV